MSADAVWYLMSQEQATTGETSTGGFLETESLTGLDWAAIALVLVTGLIHVYVGLSFGRIILTLAGLGFFGAVLLFLADIRRRTLYLAGIVYTAIQLVLFFVLLPQYPAVGLFDKAVQVVLIVLLAYLYRRSTAPAGERVGETESVVD